MNKEEIFEQVLNYFKDYYKLTIEHPYNDGYIALKKNSKEIGAFNSDGYNLLRNLTALCKALESELY